MKSFTTLFIAISLALVLAFWFLARENNIQQTSPKIPESSQSSTTLNQDSLAFANNGNLKSQTPSPTSIKSETVVQSSSTISNEPTKIMQKETYLVTLKTNQGDVVLELFAKEVPNTVQNFIELAQSGFYNNVKFHRVIKGFMIQGGDPNTKDDNAKNTWGMGGPGYRFADEFAKGLSNVPGTISMANSGPNTNGSQFFINTADNSFLDGKHAVFGKVVKGLDVVQKIENSKTDGADRPIEAVVIKSVSVE